MVYFMAILVIVALLAFYMAWNLGANDVANAIGTSVGSGDYTQTGNHYGWGVRVSWCCLVWTRGNIYLGNKNC
jgi:hypothetical protein